MEDKLKNETIKVKAGKWGNNLGLRIPKEIQQESDFPSNLEFLLSVEETADGRMRLVFEEEPSLSLRAEIAESLSGIIPNGEDVTDEELERIKKQGRLKKYGLLD